MSRRLLVTSALPYANGPIHIGHLVEYLETDIWVRFMRLRGHRVVYICADDTHGTSIMMRARQENRGEEELITEMSQSHQQDFADFLIRFDHYGSTNSPETRTLCHEIWSALRKAGLVSEREVTQLFDPKAGVFLADRFVKGNCPRCDSANQYGDACDRCGSTYSATELKNPISTLSGAVPDVRSAKHLFVQIEALHEFLASYIEESGRLQPEIANYLKGHFLAEPLRDWDVSRPAPYFGFEIPDAPGNYWYVWFDAPIGYMGSTVAWCAENGEKFDDWWRSRETEIVHFIGKDIVYFHTLFWPAMLKTAGFELPRRVQVHGFLTVDGEKMSKSKGTFVMARTYLQQLDPEYLRYYYASKLGPRVEDLDLNRDEFVNKVNADLVGKVVNLASRSARFVQTSGLSPSYPEDEGLFAEGVRVGEEVAQAYEICDFARAMRAVMSFADRANEYIDRKEPWKLTKQGEMQKAQDVCTVALNLYRQMALYLSPVLPKLGEQTRKLLGVPLASWEEAKTPLVGTALQPFQHLMQRVDPKKLEAVVAASVEAPLGVQAPSEEAISSASPETVVSPRVAAAASDDGAALVAEPLSPECNIDDFNKVDLRVARVVAAEEVPEAKKLIKLTLSLGGDVTRSVFAGIKSAYAPASLVGRLVVVVANLAPRKMKFGVSEGMVIAAGPGEKDIFLLSPDSGAKPGQRVH